MAALYLSYLNSHSVLNLEELNDQWFISIDTIYKNQTLLCTPVHQNSYHIIYGIKYIKFQELLIV